MLYFFVRVLVNALALAITFALLPGIQVTSFRAEPLAITYLTLGIALGIVNSLVRPFVVLLTARLLVSSMGLFAFVINFVLFGALGVVASDAITFAPPAWLWVALGSLVMSIVVVGMEAIFGLDSPVVTGYTNRSRGVWRWLGRLPTGQRNPLTENLRVYLILRAVISYTKDIGIGLTPMGRFRLFMQQLLYPGQDTLGEQKLPGKVRILLQDLGPTFVKFGQVVSSRAEDLPADWRDELAKLQSNVPPFSYEEAERIISRELHRPTSELYASLEREPFAAASTAQVHRATLHDGTAVVVKVQRPDIDVTMRADLNVMRDLTEVFQRRWAWARELDIKGLLGEFADNVMLELNYNNESINARQLAHNMCGLSAIHVPAVYPDMTCTRVMTQEFVRGVKITAVDKLDAAGVDRSAVAREFLRAMLKQVLFDGFFHADPHPGNVLVDTTTSQIIFLDMGLMGDMTQEQRLALADLIWSLHDRDGVSLAKTVMQLSRRFKPVDEQAFVQDVDRLIKRYLVFSDENLNLSGPINEMLNVMRQAGLRMDSSLTLALKALFQAEETVRTLDPNLPLVSVAFEELKELFRAHLDADTVMGTVRTQVTRAAKDIVRRIPDLAEATLKWIDQYEKGKFSVTVDTTEIAKEVDKVDATLTRSVTLLALAILLAGLLVGSAIASTLQIELGGIKLASIAFFLFLAGAAVASVLGLRIAWGVWTTWSSSKEGR